MTRPTGSPADDIGLGDIASALTAALSRLVPDGPVGVAVSGGGDSMALLAGTIAAIGPGRVHAATVDHGIRSESAAEARWVAQHCADRGVSHCILTIDAPGSGNLSAMLRERRYRSLAAWAQAKGLPDILLGHTLDDQAETVLMRLSRGSGVDGLSAMAETVERDGIRWLRPMLGLRRDDLRAYLRAEGIQWIDDPTNDDLAFDRIKARKALAALAPLGIDAAGLAATATRLSRSRIVLQSAAKALAGEAARHGWAGDVILDPRRLASAAPETQERLLATLVCELTDAAYPPRHRAVAGALQAALGPQPRAATLAGCILIPWRGRLHLCREPAAAPPPIPWPGASAIWDRRWSVEAAPRGAATIAALTEAGLASLPNAAPPPGAPRVAWAGVPSVRATDGSVLAAAIPTLPDKHHLRAIRIHPPGGILSSLAIDTP
ncbi:MAG: tRNA lysidine(34) synthetase TilS [Pseudomonadota bacterium]